MKEEKTSEESVVSTGILMFVDKILSALLKEEARLRRRNLHYTVTVTSGGHCSSFIGVW